MTLTARKPSQELVNLVGALGGTWSGFYAMCRCPAHADSDPSLSLRQGDRAVLVTCFAGCDPEDVLRELGRVRPGYNYPYPRADHRSGTANVVRLWAQSLPAQGSPAERYLRRRFLRSDLRDLRYHPRCPLGRKPLTKFKPALMVAVREGRRLRALQRIFLDAATGWYEAKVMLGTPGAGAWQGTAPTDTLAIAEGFEDAAAFEHLYGVPCWSPLGARRFDQIQVPDGVTRLILAEDGDPEGRRAGDKAEERYRRPGLKIERMPPPPGIKDWAKLLEQRSGRATAA